MTLASGTVLEQLVMTQIQRSWGQGFNSNINPWLPWGISRVLFFVLLGPQSSVLLHLKYASDVLQCYGCIMKVLEGVLLNKLFYRLCFRVFTAHKFGASFGRRLPFIAYLSTTAHKGPFESIQNMPIMPYYDTVALRESIRRFYNAWAIYRLYFWVFAVSILSVFNTNILILLLMMIHIQIRAVSIVIIEQLLIIIIVVFLVLVAIICLEVDIVLGGAVEHIICISLALPPSLGGSKNSLDITNQHKHSPCYNKSMHSNTIRIYYS